METKTILQLSQKLCTLFLLVTGQRGQTLHLTKLQDITFNAEKSIVTIRPSELLKQSKPGKHLNPIILKSLNGKRNICVVKTLLEYLERTEILRNGDSLIISTVKPFKPAARATISRWLKQILVDAGVGDTFKPHSVRSASTSKALQKGISVQNILKTAGWSNAKTFAKFYGKDIEDCYSVKFQSAIVG